MSFNKSSDEDEHAAAVAATAFAISSLEPEEADQRNMTRPQSSLPRIRSNIADTERNEMIPEKTIHPVPSPKKIPTMPRKRLSFADQVAEKPALTPPSIERTPTVKKTPTFGDEEFENEGRIRPPMRTPTVKKTPSFAQDTFDDAKSMNPEFSAPPFLPPPIPPHTIQPPVPPKTASRHTDWETDADVWEREQMAKIKQRYEKLNTTILEWEDNKRKKARSKLETTEVSFEHKQDSSCQKFKKAILTMICCQESQSELEKRRAKAMQKYQTEMEQIKLIADGARSQAKAKQRNEELKVMDKANRYRTTGEPPRPQMCHCL